MCVCVYLHRQKGYVALSRVCLTHTGNWGAQVTSRCHRTGGAVGVRASPHEAPHVNRSELVRGR